MNFIYDVVLNFNKELYEFYEWDKKDNVLSIKKIPLFVVNNDTFKALKYDRVTLDKDFVDLIRDKTFTYNKTKIGNATLITNGKEVFGILVSNDGLVTKKSCLLLNEEEDVLEEIFNEELFDINIIKRKKNIVQSGNRKERDKKNFLIKFINKEDNISNLKYLYYDYFEKEEDNIMVIKDSLINEIKNNYNNKTNNLYETVKTFNKIKKT